MANADTTLTLKKQSEATWGNETVTVASKLPMPFTLQLHHKVKRRIQAHGGVTEIEVFEPVIGTKSKPSSFIVNGNSYIKRQGDAGGDIQFGYSITTGIPKDFWEEWEAQYRDLDAVKNGMIFAHKEKASTLAQAREYEEQKSGMERLPKDDPKELARIQKGVETSDHFRKSA